MPHFPPIGYNERAVAAQLGIDLQGCTTYNPSMDARQALKDFLAKADLKPAQFARSIEYDRSNFHRLLNDDDALPSLPLATRIERETGGAVLASAWTRPAGAQVAA